MSIYSLQRMIIITAKLAMKTKSSEEQMTKSISRAVIMV